jgi:hypothetical protein
MRRIKERRFGLEGSKLFLPLRHFNFETSCLSGKNSYKPDIYKFYTKNIEIVQNFIGLYQVKFVSFRESFVLSLNIDFLCSHF